MPRRRGKKVSRPDKKGARERLQSIVPAEAEVEEVQEVQDAAATGTAGDDGTETVISVRRDNPLATRRLNLRPRDVGADLTVMASTDEVVDSGLGRLLQRRVELEDEKAQVEAAIEAEGVNLPARRSNLPTEAEAPRSVQHEWPNPKVDRTPAKPARRSRIKRIAISVAIAIGLVLGAILAGLVIANFLSAEIFPPVIEITPTALLTATAAATTQPPRTPTLTVTPQPTKTPVPTERPQFASPGCRIEEIVKFHPLLPLDNTVVAPGSKLLKSWMLVNPTNCRWSGYRLVPDEENPFGAQAVAVPQVEPEGVVIVSVNITAPQDSGIHIGYWRLEASNGAQGNPISAIVLVDESLPIGRTKNGAARVKAAAQTCQQYVAQFVKDITVPDGSELTAGQEFVKIWRIKNAGECTWSDRLELVFAGGSQMGSPSGVKIGLEDDVKPGEMIDVSVTLVVPSKPTGRDTIRGTWRLRDLATDWVFGGFTTEIRVVASN